MGKKVFIMLIGLIVLCSVAAHASDFRNVNWEMSIEEVKKNEVNTLVSESVRDQDYDYELIYDFADIANYIGSDIKLGYFNSQIFYRFLNNRLISAGYVFYDRWKFGKNQIDLHDKLVKKLSSMYGMPLENQIWLVQNSMFKNMKQRDVLPQALWRTELILETSFSNSDVVMQLSDGNENDFTTLKYTIEHFRKDYRNKYLADLEADNHINVKAYRSIAFGDSKRTVTEKIKQDPEITALSEEKAQDLTDVRSLVSVKINGAIYYMGFEFYRDQLYSVSFKSASSYTADYLKSKIKDQVDFLAATMNSKYGEPTWYKELSILDLDSQFVTFSHIWDETRTGDRKVIKIGIGASDAKFYAAMYIEYLPLLQEKERQNSTNFENEIKETGEDF